MSDRPTPSYPRRQGFMIPRVSVPIYGARRADCSGCRCCPNGACEPDEPLGPGVCGHTCPCHPDFYREEQDHD